MTTLAAIFALLLVAAIADIVYLNHMWRKALDGWKWAQDALAKELDRQ